VQLDKITAILLQLVDRLVTSLLRTHLVRAFFKNSSVGGPSTKRDHTAYYTERSEMIDGLLVTKILVWYRF
jgi:hypothetical protein